MVHPFVVNSECTKRRIRTFFRQKGCAWGVRLVEWWENITMARQALGTGLNALLARQKTGAAPSRQDSERVVMARVDEIAPSPFQPRRTFPQEQIDELAASIRERGLVQPLVVRRVEGGKLELIAGERRLRAVAGLGQAEVKVIVMEATDQEVAEITLIENLQREDLSALEEAEQYRLLQTRFKMKQEEIARHVGKSRAVVANMVRLLELAPEVRDMLERSELTVGHAKVLLQIKDAESQTLAAHRVVLRGLTVRQTEQLVRRMLNPEPPTPEPELPKAYEKLCRQLSGMLGANVSISLKGKKGGVIEIPYSGEDELKSVLEAMGIKISL